MIPNNPRLLNLPHDTWRPLQAETVQWCMDLDGVGLVDAPTGCHRAGTQVLLYDGTLENVEDILVGDVLMGMNSRPRKVLSLIRGFGPMYKIEPVKGEPFIVNLDHVLTVVRTNTEKYQDEKIKDVTIREYLSWAKYKKHLHKLFREPCSFPVHNKPMWIDPYFLGVLLGDGHLRKNGTSITTMEPEIVAEIYRWAMLWQMKVRIVEGNSGRAKTYVYNKPYGGIGRTYLEVCLQRLELLNTHSGNKFIPHRYKTASVQDRLALLAGLMDTDGHLSRGSCFDYISKSKVLADDVAFVCRSVGLAAYVRECKKSSQNGTVGIYHRVSISGKVSKIPCRTRRKKAKRRKQKKNVRRTGFKVTKVSDEESFYGFTLDGDGRYLLADFTVTHNSGKTSYAASCAYDHATTALCRTKSLQHENYGDMYGFNVLTGKGTYSCIHPDALPDATCADCLHVERGEGGKGMHSCEYSSGCKYLVQKATVLSSRCASLNYAYWLSSYGVRQRPTEYLFLDECHQLSDLVLEWAGCTVRNADRAQWGLPLFPLASTKSMSSSKSLVQIEDTSTDKVLDWLADSIEILEATLQQLGPTDRWGRPLPLPPEQRKAARECEQLLRKLRTTLEGLELVQEDWFVQSGPLALTWGQERRPGLLVKPLTARYHYPRFFPSGNGGEMDEKHPRCILMSATVGNFDAFAQELGIQTFSSRRVPSQWGPEQRPVYVLDVPRLGYKSKREDYEQQADAIAEAILTVPSTWSGIIHVTRKREAPLLANRLASRGLQKRVWVPPEGSTNWAARKWEERKRRVQGSLMIAWQFHEGFDGLDERICVSAKCPFPSLGDPYEQARQRRSGKFYLQRTAWSLMQMLGRTRRGREQDYDTEDEQRSLVLIADMNYKRVRKYLSTDFMESVQQWPT